MRTNWLRITGGLFGIAAVLLMVFANQLGLESFPTWGVRRTAILLAGLLLTFVAVFYTKENLIGRTIHSADGRLYTVLIALNVGIILIYIWFGSDGLWKSMHNETNYYDLQANAFAKGQIALDVEPDPALLAFTNESLYEPENRAGIPVLWDATLYNGKYYLYWGPAPALVLTPLKFLYKEDLGDKLLSLLFMIGTLVFLNLTILNLWRRYFAHIPHWAVLAAVALAGLVNPMPFVMVEGRIYEAAIIAAQFFLVGGLYFLLSTIQHPNPTRLIFSGLFLTLAIGSRTPLAPGVGLLSLVLLIWAYREHRSRMIPILLAFALPLVIGAVAYASYNYVRFGSFTEFGFKYQLTSYNLYNDLDQTLSLAYAPPNLYKTLFNPLEQRNTFPYIFPTRWAGPEWLTNYRPGFYLTLSESITGIFISSPFLLLALLSLYKPRHDLQWVLLALTLGALGIFIILQTYFFIAMRYLLDVIPVLALLAILGFWHGFDVFKNKYAYLTISLLLLTYTLTLSLLISFSGNLELFRIHNPDFIKELNWTFNSLFK